MLKYLSSLFALLVLLGAPAHAQLTEATFQDVGRAFNDCIEATKDGLVVKRLETRGWVRATHDPLDGKLLSEDRVIYQHDENKLLIYIGGDTDLGICMAAGPVDNFEAAKEFMSIFGDVSKPTENGGVEFWLNGGLVQINPTGTAENPSIRIVAFTPMENN
ncbi:MAG: hypothetical protein QNI87_05940 [Erythrobacter sp.]|uniref:hypothetical protein n=1 Tax=Erythrobacter sp. TaxID=1042 RepID=UPI0026376BB4|nr:hypothetical protein [Erythrobacter sp.]MDJ0978056.1 hypothetical protein [Erythrobacter sp.]